MLVSIMAHLLRVFFTGAYRKPREVTWLIGVTMFALAMIEGFLGYSLPDDQLSGTGIRIAEGVLEGVPVAGTYLTFFLFGGQFPRTEFISRFYVIHVLLVPGLIAVLLTAHLAAVVVQKHTQMPADGRTIRNVVGPPVYPNDHGQSLPLITHLFIREPEMREDYNRSAPSGDNDRFASHIAAVIGETTRLAGSSADPAAYAQRAVGKLSVMTLPYQLGTPGFFYYAGFNERDLDDDVMDVMLSRATNSALGDGVAPDPARTGGEFPYFRAD